MDFVCFYLFFKFIFNWRIMLYDVMMVSAQQCVSAVCIHIHPPSWVSLPSSPSHPLGHQRTQSWASCTIQHFPLASYFTLGSVYTGNPLQCSCLENPRDGGAWWAAVYGVAQSPTRLKRLSAVAAMCTYVSATLCPTVSFPCCVHKSVVYVCISISALQIGSSAP